ncbi:MAG TPA: SCO6880 family protein [Candidatus Dormibacteraeota bacterium]|nr:SCO6880 family protein [Candidatus Dormibacteraeota bacterium]
MSVETADGSSTEAAAPRFVFPPPHNPGIFLGIRFPQLALMITGLVLGLITLHFVPRALGALVVCGWCVAFGALALVPINGHHADEWVLVLSGYVTRNRLTRRRGDPRAIPHVLPEVSLLTLERAGRRYGVLREEQAAGEVAYCALMQLGAMPFVLRSVEERVAQLNRWGLVLGSLVREHSPLSRIQLLHRTAPGAARDNRSWFARYADPSSPFFEDALAEQIDRRPPTEHENFVVVQVSLTRLGRRQASRRGGGDVDLGAMNVLAAEVERLRAELHEILPGAAVLSPGGVAAVMRNAYDPEARRFHDGHEVSWDTVSPSFERETATHYEAQQFHHATFGVRHFPRLPVDCGFQIPLILEARAAHCYSIVLEPVPPSRALRAAESARTSDIGDAQMRAARGFIETASRRNQRAGIERREQELAEGHREFIYAGYITVSAEGAEALETAIADVEDCALRSHLDLQRLVGEQGPAFTFTLPLCRGL